MVFLPDWSPARLHVLRKADAKNRVPIVCYSISCALCIVHWLKAGEELGGGFAEEGVAPGALELGEWAQHEFAQMHARMR